ncbi:MAG: Glycosyl hydrolase, family 35, partial [Candidatus Moranbacteria bacterium GW2011_GWD2_38_7]
MKKRNPAKEKFISATKMTLKVMLYIFGIVLALFLLLLAYSNLPVKKSQNDAKIGVTFSYVYAEQIGLDWKQAYLAMLDDIKIKHVRLPIYWDRVELTEGNYDFSPIDWQLEQAQKRGVEVILVVGQKVPRWPECYVPRWVGTDPSNLDAAILKEKLLAFEKVAINRYKDNHPEIVNWQIENEPFLDFGICSKVDVALLDAELEQVRKIDSSRPIVVTDSGELSLWILAASRADVFGTTMYREVYSENMGHWRYPIGPNFFKMKQLVIKLFANQNNAIVIELQGEPWV